MRKTDAELRADGLREAAERMASMTPELRRTVETALAGLNSSLVRWFVGEEGKKAGYMPGYTATPEEMRAFRALNPATHRWAAWEKSLMQLHEGEEFPDRAYINGEPGQEQGAIRCVGDDVTELLGVTKYEPALPTGSADVEGQFFDGVPKTDEDRVQSRHDLLALLQCRPYYITVKCDGASMTVASHDSRAKVASRNYRLADTPDSAYWRAARADDDALLDLVVDQPWLAVQGELVGPGIQSNRLGLTDHRCLVFNIFDRTLEYHEGKGYLSLDEMLTLQAFWGFHMVPLVATGANFQSDQDELLYLAGMDKYEGTTNEREGIVIRNNDDGPRVSFKAISNRYLLKGGE